MYGLDKEDSMFVQEFKLERNVRLARHYKRPYLKFINTVRLYLVRRKQKKERRK